jgi:hypothetical protein
LQKYKKLCKIHNMLNTFLKKHNNCFKISIGKHHQDRHYY